MTSRRLFAIVLAFALAEGLAPPRGVDVTTAARDGRVYVSCSFQANETDELDEAIHAGLTSSITYEVDLRRSVGFFERTLASATVAASVQHDTLTGRYQLTRAVDGRIEDTLVSEDLVVVKRFLTQFTKLPLFSTADLEPNVEYAVRVRVKTRPQKTWFFWPWDRTTASGLARFTFIP